MNLTSLGFYSSKSNNPSPWFGEMSISSSASTRLLDSDRFGMFY